MLQHLQVLFTFAVVALLLSLVLLLLLLLLLSWLPLELTWCSTVGANCWWSTACIVCTALFSLSILFDSVCVRSSGGKAQNATLAKGHQLGLLDPEHHERTLNSKP